MPALTAHEPETIQCERSSIEVSIVMPCLNEADTLATCIEKAQKALATAKINGEIIVADNGRRTARRTSQRASVRASCPCPNGDTGTRSWAGSPPRAVATSSWVMPTIATIFASSRSSSKSFVKVTTSCRAVGCPPGGGRVLPGAMPITHRWIGNPMFSSLARRWFRAPIHDVYCGMRGFTKGHYESLDQRCTGMEFATEMIIKTSLYGARVTEVPITLHPDGRKAHPPHLKTVRDGWRTLRFFLMYSPRWLFVKPGLLLILLGLVGYILALPGITISGATLDAHTLLFSSLALLLGYNSILFGVFTKTFAVSEKLLPPDRRLEKLFDVMPLERGIAIGATILFAGDRLAGGRHQAVVGCGVWSLRVHVHHALGYSGCHDGGIGIPNDSRELLPQYSPFAEKMTTVIEHIHGNYIHKSA